MKAIVVHEFGGPEVLRVEEVPVPAPGRGEVLVRMHAAGVNPVDTYLRGGSYGRKPPSLPYTPGYDGAGLVQQVGEGVDGWAPGARVYVAGTATLGTYAQWALCTASQVHPLPDHVSFEQGAAVGVPYGTAWRALFQRGAARPGDTVLVHGASGGVGVAALQMARAAGMRTIGTAGTDAGAALARAEGAELVFDHHAAGYAQRILEATGGRGVDVVIEMLANVNLARDLTLLARHGRVVVVGNRGTIEINPRDAMTREADIRGMQLANTPPDDLARVHAGIAAGLANGTLQPVVGRRFQLADAPLAHEAVMSPGAHGKIVLTIPA
ncbi:MAG: NADPH:quinone reductase [Acidobacteria bacterium]|nr:NADPH:quinone reductase [Acidobacteriota bacterium]